MQGKTVAENPAKQKALIPPGVNENPDPGDPQPNTDASGARALIALQPDPVSSDSEASATAVTAEPTSAATTTPSSATLGDAEAEATASRTVRRRKKKKKNKAPLVLGAMCVAVLMLMIGLVVRDPTEPEAKKKERPPMPAVIPPVTNKPPPSRGNASDERPIGQNLTGYELVSDDRLLFVPPYGTDVPSAPLDLLPPGPALILSIRLGSVLDSKPGGELIEAFSPGLDDVIATIATRTKVPLEAISRCTAAMHPGRGGWPEVSLAIELKEPQAADELLEKWQVAASRTPGGATILAGDAVGSDAYFVADMDSPSVSRFAVGSVERISEVAAAEGGAIPLPRTSQALWDGSSDEADLVVLITPNFLFADGRAFSSHLRPS